MTTDKDQTVTINTPDDYEAARARYRILIGRMNDAEAKRDYPARAAAAREAVPIENALNAYEAEHDTTVDDHPLRKPTTPLRSKGSEWA